MRDALMLAAVAVLAVATCSGGDDVAATAATETTPPATSPADPSLQQELSGYLFADASSAVFLWWTESDALLNGSIVWARVSDDGLRIDHGSAQFSGELRGDGARLDFVGQVGLFGSSTSVSSVDVVIGDSALTWTVVGTDGRLRTTSMRRALSADYNDVVSELERSAETLSERMQAEALNQEREQAEATEAKRVADVADLVARIDRLSPQADEAITVVRDRFQQLQREANVSPMTEEQAARVEVAAAEVENAWADLDSVVFDLNTQLRSLERIGTESELAGPRSDVGNAEALLDEAADLRDQAWEISAAAWSGG